MARLDSDVDGNGIGTISTSTEREHEAMQLIGGMPLYNTNHDLRDSTANKNGGDELTKAF